MLPLNAMAILCLSRHPYYLLRRPVMLGKILYYIFFVIAIFYLFKMDTKILEEGLDGKVTTREMTRGECFIIIVLPALFYYLAGLICRFYL